MNELICPHCGEVQYNHELDNISAVACFTECEHCGKSIWYSVYVIREYMTLDMEE